MVKDSYELCIDFGMGIAEASYPDEASMQIAIDKLSEVGVSAVIQAYGLQCPACKRVANEPL